MSRISSIPSLGYWYLAPSKRLRRSTDTVYGAAVASADFIEALVRHTSIPVLELLTPWDGDGSAPKAPASAGLRPDGAPVINIRPVDGTFTNRPELPLGAYHDISADPSRGFRLRQHFSPRPFPVTLTHHTVSYASQREDFYLRALLEDVRPYDSIICTSTAARDAIRLALDEQRARLERLCVGARIYPGRLDVLPLGVDTELFRPRDRADARYQLGLPAQPFVFLWVGRLSHAQKADLLPLVRVFSRLVRANPRRDLLLVIAGTDVDRDSAYLEDFAEKLKIDTRVRVITDLDPSRRHLMFGAADVFVSPVDNVQETFGITPIEAMASGIPQVVSDWDGYRDTVAEGETGFRIPTRWMRADSDVMPATAVRKDFHLDHAVAAQGTVVDFEALEAKLQVLLDGEELRHKMGKASRQRALKLFGWKPVIASYEALWKELSAQAQSDAKREARAGPMDPHSLFNIFHGYATEIVPQARRIRLRADAEDVVDGKEPVPDYYQGVGLDLSFTTALMQELLGAGRKGKSFEQLVAAFPDTHPDAVRRRAMWLLKYGYAELVS